MLAKKLVPSKFILAIGEIVLAGILIATANVYPSKQSSSSAEFIVGCALIIIMTAVQIVFTFIGINVYNSRINFQNMICNGFALLLLIWFALQQWDQSFIWYIWGFLCLYPFFNQFAGMASILFHSRKTIFEKYRAQQ